MVILIVLCLLTHEFCTLIYISSSRMHWAQESLKSRFTVVTYTPPGPTYSFAMGGSKDGKGAKGLPSQDAQDELKKLAGQQTTAQAKQAMEEMATKRAQGLKRRMEDYLPDLRPAGTALCTAVAKNHTCEYFLVSVSLYFRLIYTTVEQCVLASAKYAVNKSVPWLIAMMDLLTVENLIMLQYSISPGWTTASFVDGDRNAEPDSAGRGVAYAAMSTTTLSISEPNSWASRIIGGSEDNQSSKVLPLFKWPAFDFN